MIPESKYINSEFSFREMALPDEVRLTRRSLVRWVALSLGMISPNESRKLVIDLLDALFYFHSKGQNPTTAEILQKLEETTGSKPNEKAVYYHLLKMKDAGVLARKDMRYYFVDFEGGKLSEVFRRYYNEKLGKLFVKLEAAFGTLEKSYE